MRNSILLIILALFFSLNITGCSLFSSDEDEQETATVAEEGMPAGMGDFSDDEFASDDFESGGELGGDDLGGESLGDDLGGGDEFAAGGDDFGDEFGDDLGGDEFASGGGDEFADDQFGGDLDFDAEGMAKGEGEAGFDDLAGEDIEVEDNFGDEYPDDDYAQLGESAGNDFSEDYIDDNSFGAADTNSFESQPVDDSLFVDEGGIPADTMSGNQDTDLFSQGQDMEPVVDTPTYEDSSFADAGTGYDSFDNGVEEKSYVPVKKMKPAAYTRAGGNVNRLYVVRAGDDMDSIAQKIYGDSSRSEDLYSYNSHFRGKSLKVGDKVYYESPINPTDQRMVTYYEDNSIAPQYYTSDEGDNIRKVSESLLGHERSWMEIWATNEDVQSKWTLPAGVRLRYWPEGASVPTTVAMNDPVNDPPAMEEPAAAPPMPEPTAEPEPMPSEEPPPPPSDMAMNEPEMPDLNNNEDMAMNESDEMAQLDDPQAFDDGMSEDMEPPPVAGTTETPPPPKPVAPPPPPPPAPKADFNKPAPPKQVDINPPGSSDDPLAAFSDDSTIMAGIGALLILAAVIVLIFIRRNRAKRVNFSQTQV